VRGGREKGRRECVSNKGGRSERWGKEGKEEKNPPNFGASKFLRCQGPFVLINVKDINN
jgi:hypothetical protein